MNTLIDVEKLKKWIIGSDLLSALKIDIISLIDSNRGAKQKKIERLVSEIVDSEGRVFEAAKDSESIEEWNDAIIENIEIPTDNLSRNCINNILECLIHHRSLERAADVENFVKWMNYMGRKVM